MKPEQFVCVSCVGHREKIKIIQEIQMSLLDLDSDPFIEKYVDYY